MHISNVKIEPEIAAKFEEATKLLNDISRALLLGNSLGVEHDPRFTRDRDEEHVEDRLEIASLVTCYSRLIMRLGHGVLPSEKEVDANKVLTQLLSTIMFQATSKAFNESEKSKMDLRKARIDEVESLVRLRQTMVGVGDKVSEIDIRIAAMKNVLFDSDAKAA